MEKQYEIMLIFKKDSKLSEKGVFFKKFSELLKTVDGKAEKEEFWGLRKFSYPIQKLTEGVYSVIEFECPSNKVKTVDSKLKLEKDVIRHLISLRSVK